MASRAPSQTGWIKPVPDIPRSGRLAARPTPDRTPSPRSLEEELTNFADFGTRTRQPVATLGGNLGIPSNVRVYVNEFWTSKQRDASRLHEISYRACFKPQLPRFFIERLTEPGDTVYDPFMGRGTTLIEAALLGRRPQGCDVNPLSAILTFPRLNPPKLEEIRERIEGLDLSGSQEFPEDLLVFYHPETLGPICALRNYLQEREASGKMDDVDRWIRMVAINRLTGHSRGFFSVYTLPPNLAVSLQSQRKINAKRGQSPEPRDVPSILLKKSAALLAGLLPDVAERLRTSARAAMILTRESSHTPEISSSSVSLVVTSPPFLDVVNYAKDNWLRGWFAGIDVASLPITMARRLDDWKLAMTATLIEVKRVLKDGGHVAFEVGEVRNGTVPLEETVIRCGMEAGLTPRLVLINDQEFTKTSNCWGVDNGRGGTNSNRIALFRK